MRFLQILYMLSIQDIREMGVSNKMIADEEKKRLMMQPLQKSVSSVMALFGFEPETFGS
jgi:Flp pilus assembly protein protease CpaA